MPMQTFACDLCGKSFDRYPQRVARFKNKFCSNTCRHAYQTKENHPQWKGGRVEVYCAICGKSLTRAHHEVERRSERFFCNVECRGKWQSENLVGDDHPNFKGAYIVNCMSCGAELERPRWWHTREQSLVFCNYQCMGDWYAENRAGATRYNWKGGKKYHPGPNWQRQRKRALRRDNFTCQACSTAEKKTKALHVHHIIPFREFDYIPGANENYKQANELSNLITLCYRCHKLVEHGHIPVQIPLPISSV